ncbi:MAG: GNAT family N-acetyltransferase [Anaerolineales bacterium]|nr:GNAT family N-acetyltransferase [Anaerolineales bacterium]
MTLGPESVPPESLIFRPPTLDDIPAVVEFLNLTWGEMVGVEEFSAGELRHEWQEPGFDPQAQIRLTTGPDGEILGFAEYYLREPFTRGFGWIQVHPDWRESDIVSRSYEWILESARSAIIKAPDGARVSLVFYTSENDPFMPDFLLSRDYTILRRFLKMLIEMEAEPDPVMWPLGLDGKTPITVHTYQDGELKAVVQAMRDSFQDHWGYVERPFELDLELWQHRIEEDDFDPSLWFLVRDGGRIAGISLCRPYMTGQEDTGWVSVLGVLRPWRRKGLGTALLKHSFVELYRRGQRKVGLDVDAESLTGALRLYEKAGMHLHHEFRDYELELRPGVELGTTRVEGGPDSDGD